MSPKWDLIEHSRRQKKNIKYIRSVRSSTYQPQKTRDLDKISMLNIDSLESVSLELELAERN